MGQYQSKGVQITRGDGKLVITMPDTALVSDTTLAALINLQVQVQDFGSLEILLFNLQQHALQVEPEHFEVWRKEHHQLATLASFLHNLRDNQRELPEREQNLVDQFFNFLQNQEENEPQELEDVMAKLAASLQRLSGGTMEIQ